MFIIQALFLQEVIGARGFFYRGTGLKLFTIFPINIFTFDRTAAQHCTRLSYFHSQILLSLGTGLCIVAAILYIYSSYLKLERRFKMNISILGEV